MMFRTFLQYVEHRIAARREYQSHLAELNATQEAREENETFFTDIIDHPGKHRKRSEWNE